MTTEPVQRGGHSRTEVYFLYGANYKQKRNQFRGMIPDELRLRLPLAESMDGTYRVAVDENHGFDRAKFVELYAKLRAQGVLRPFSASEIDAVRELEALGHKLTTSSTELEAIDLGRLREVYPQAVTDPIV
ncbi:hypothetical protein [Frigoribacterium sp. CFBP 8751]|uniref:hypothetical protein n=1 Tax=Frigoribacterium sp. CFBP 8751 TaxID=2775277 RepID=UPI0017870E10|nr:hypothetical protein [Frigoribacterium sp. CFBP 8751]MBD8539191.1 hypothetical protein [Frigoribacterium sp. CFBP 8751]